MTEPFMSPVMRLEPEWIDHNGHLNMAYYGVLFDRCTDHAQEIVGLGPDYTRTSGFTTFSGEFRIRYLRELKPGSRVRASFHLLELGPKSYHFCQELFHEDGWVSATGEGVSLHIDQDGPKVAPYPEEIHARLADMAAAHSALPVPDWVGMPMGIRRK